MKKFVCKVCGYVYEGEEASQRYVFFEASCHSLKPVNNLIISSSGIIDVGAEFGLIIVIRFGMG